MKLDHLAVAAETLDEGVAWAEEKFGVPFGAGGKHTRYGTHNRLLGLDGAIYLEVIAIDPEATCDVPRWFDLDRFQGPPRLVNWICEPAHLDDCLQHGMERVSMTRGELNWDMGVPAHGALPLDGGYPTVLKWHTDAPPGVGMKSSGWALKRLTVEHPQAKAIKTSLPELSDARIVFKVAPDVNLSATFGTALGDEVTI